MKQHKKVTSLFRGILSVLTLLTVIIVGMTMTAQAADFFFNNCISDTVLYPSGCLKSMKIKIVPDYGYEVAYGKIAIHTQESQYDWDNRYLSSGQTTWDGVDTNFLKTNDGLLEWSEGPEFCWTNWNTSTSDGSNIVSVVFNDGEIDLTKTGTFYIYIWTRSEYYGIYTDGLIGTLTSGDGRLMAGNEVVAEKPAHTHSFTYAANEATLTATCQNADCGLTDNAVSFTINAPAKTRYSDGKSAAATLTGVDDFNAATEKSVSAAAIVYFKNNVQLDAAPENAGTYQARITVEGATAVVEYTIAKLNPVFFAPDTRNTTYGNTLEDVTLPTDPNGVWTWKDDLTTSVGNAGVKTFTAVYTPNDENYNTKEVAVTVNVAKANPDYQIPANLTATVGGTLADVTLPNGWTWQENSTPLDAVGEKTFKATFTPADTDNYNIVENIEVPVNVGKAIPVYETPTGLTATYGGTLADVTLPDDENGTWAWKDDSESVGNAGENSRIAVFTPNDPDYAVVEVPVRITVGKANPVYEIPTGLTATEGDTLADVIATEGDTLASVTLPAGWSWKDSSESVGAAGEKTFMATFTPADTDNYNIVENIPVTVTVRAKTPDTPSNGKGNFRCGFCDEYEYWKDTPVIGWFVSLVHIFVHLAAHIGHIS